MKGSSCVGLHIASSNEQAASIGSAQLRYNCPLFQKAGVCSEEDDYPLVV